MASVIARSGAAVGLPGVSPAFLAAALTAPIVLGIARALPAEGGGLALRLVAAAALVLLVPGWLLVCALGRSTRPGLTLAASFASSLALCFLAFALTFTAGASLPLTIATLAIAMAGSLLAAARATPVRLEPDDVRAIAWLALLGAGLCGLVWWSATTVSGDELSQLARVRKLDEVPALFGISVVNEFRDGGPSAASAFPLWDGVLTLVGRLAGVDSSLVVQHIGGVLVPLAVVLAYAAGRELFGRVAGGVATALAQLAVVALPRAGIGDLAQLALPATASRLLIVPALLALAFAWLAERRWSWLALAAVAGLVVSTVRLSHLALIVIGLGGFAAVRLLGGRAGREDAGLTGLLLAALIVPAGLFFAWLVPVAFDTNAFLPSDAYRDAAVALHDLTLARVGGLFALDAAAVAAGGAGVVAGLVTLPVAAVAVRSRWGAFVVGATLALLAVALTPILFRPLADLMTLTEALRLPLLLPLPFAIAGATLYAARRPVLGCAMAAALGLGLVLAYRDAGAAGPAWAAWVAVAACLAALAVRPVVSEQPEGTRRVVIVAAALAIPLAAVGLSDLRRDPPDPQALPRPLVEAVRELVPVRAVVFADPETSYRLSAAAPVTVAAAPPGRAAASGENDPARRRRDAAAFFTDERLSYLEHGEMLNRFGASWLLVDRSLPVPDYVRFLPEPVFDDGRYVLYELDRRADRPPR